MGWPGFAPGRWKDLRRGLEKQLRTPPHPVVFASDSDDAACRDLRDCLAAAGLDGWAGVAQRDFFTFHPREVTARPGVVVINPPYGRRIGSRPQSATLTARIGEKLRRDYAGWRFALLGDASVRPAQIGLGGRTHPFFHGGRKINVLTGKLG